MSTALAPAHEHIDASSALLGEGMQIRRALPTRQRRLVGPWTFLDHFGPADVSHNDGMRVGPHPHIGLQTVTWLYEGEVLHRDSLGSLKTIVPGQLNVMTSGRGISHSEESPQPHAPSLHGLQFWIALPDSERHRAPAFEHHAQLPTVTADSFEGAVVVGEALGQRSPATVYSPALALDLHSTGAASTRLPLRPDFEYAVLVSIGRVTVDGEALEPGALIYLGGGRTELELSTEAASRFIVIGGEPLNEPVLMWWNFVARTREELKQAVIDWNAGAEYFGEVQGYDGARLVAPMPPW